MIDAHKADTFLRLCKNVRNLQWLLCRSGIESTELRRHQIGVLPSQAAGRQFASIPLLQQPHSVCQASVQILSVFPASVRPALSCFAQTASSSHQAEVGNFVHSIHSVDATSTAVSNLSAGSGAPRNDSDIGELDTEPIASESEADDASSDDDGNPHAERFKFPSPRHRHQQALEPAKTRQLKTMAHQLATQHRLARLRVGKRGITHSLIATAGEEH